MLDDRYSLYNMQSLPRRIKLVGILRGGTTRHDITTMVTHSRTREETKLFATFSTACISGFLDPRWRSTEERKSAN